MMIHSLTDLLPNYPGQGHSGCNSLDAFPINHSTYRHMHTNAHTKLAQYFNSSSSNYVFGLCENSEPANYSSRCGTVSHMQ